MTDPLTPEGRAELRRLCEEATLGEWQHGDESDDNAATWDVHCSEGLAYVAMVIYEEADARFIAAARAALPALLDRVEELERERETRNRWRDLATR